MTGLMSRQKNQFEWACEISSRTLSALLSIRNKTMSIQDNWIIVIAPRRFGHVKANFFVVRGQFFMKSLTHVL